MSTLLEERGLKWEAPEGQKVILHLGMGLDSVSILCAMHQMGLRPDFIIFADTDGEWPETYSYKNNVLAPWLEKVGFPAIATVRRGEEIDPKRSLYFGSLQDEIERTRTLPSMAYGMHKCSLKFKISPINKHLRRQLWCKGQWAQKKRITKVIGFNVDEPHRAKPEFGDAKEASQFVPYYPLFQWGLNREDEARIVTESGLPVPKKSACFFCPNATDAEWTRLRKDHPDLFQTCLGIEADANEEDNPHKILKPRTVGLRRRGKPGQRQLREWAQAWAEVDALEAGGCSCPGA